MVSNSSCVRFQGQTYIDEPNPAAPAAISESAVTDFNLAELVGKAGIDIKELFSMRVCPALDEYRVAVGIDPSAEDMKLGVCPIPDLSAVRTPTVYYTTSARASGASSPIPTRGDDYDGGNFDDGGMDDDGYFGAEGDDVPINDAAPSNSAAPTASASVVDASGKIRWNSVFDSTSNQGALHSAAPAVETARSTTHDDANDASFEGTTGPAEGPGIDAVPVTSEFGYFDMNQVMSQQNAWAGAKHWKFGRRTRSTHIPSETTSLINVNDAGDDSDGEEAAAGGKGKKPKKKATAKDNMFFDFESEPLPRDAFLVPKKGKTDTTVFTSAARDKQKQNAVESLYDLPPDAKLQVKDLCRMFLCPSIIVPPSQGFTHILGEANPLANSHDRVWGAAQEAPKPRKQSGRKSILLSKPINPEEPFHSMVDDAADYGDNNDDEYDGGDNFASGPGDDYRQDFNCTILDESQFFNTQSSQQSVVGLEINTGNLLKAARTVEKVDIGYATVSTKVNVRKLKSDIWDHIHRTIRNRPAPVDTENAAPPSDPVAPPARGNKAGKEKESKEAISFRGLIGTVSQKQEQSSVTLPFYFICLLHLANEKVRLHCLPQLCKHVFSFCLCFHSIHCRRWRSKAQRTWTISSFLKKSRTYLYISRVDVSRWYYQSTFVKKNNYRVRNIQ